MTMTMNNKHIELLKFCGYDVDVEKNKIIDKNKNSLVTIVFEPLTGFFTIKIQSHRFIPNNYDAIEEFSIDLNKKLSLIYELNTFIGGDKNVCS